MNTLKGLSLTALLLAGSMTFIAPTQANTEALPEATTQALIQAPDTALIYPSTTITTSPAPIAEAPTQPLIEAPVEALIEAPTVPLIEALPEATVEALPVPAPEQPTAAPTAVECMEDMPCWDCSTMGNLICGTTEAWLLFQDTQAGIPAASLATTFNSSYLGIFPIDHQSAMNTLEIPSQINPALKYAFVTEAFPCVAKLGDAKAGSMLHCYAVEASITPELTYLGSSATVDECATYFYPSALYADVFHSFTDGFSSSNPSCNRAAPVDFSVPCQEAPIGYIDSVPVYKKCGMATE